MANPAHNSYPPKSAEVWSFTNIKGGGTTKTTATMMTAFALTRRGESATVISWDRIHSAVSWADKAADGIGMWGKGLDWPENLYVEPADEVTDMHDLVVSAKTDKVLIDGGPADHESVKEIARLSDKVIVPMEPGSLVIEQAPITLDLVAEVEDEQSRRIDSRILLVRVKMATIVAEKTMAVLKGHNLNVMKMTIGERTGIGRAAHQVPRQLYGYESVVDELSRPHGQEPGSGNDPKTDSVFAEIVSKEFQQ